MIGLYEENLPGQSLLIKVMSQGRRLQPAESLGTCRTRCAEELRELPEELLGLSKADSPYPVDLSPGLVRLRSTIGQPQKEPQP